MRRALLRYASSIATKTRTNKRPAALRMAFDKAKFEDLLKRRFFYDQSFSIYSGIGGLYDYGPMGCATKTNIIQAWRNHFILNEAMLEVECTALTPEPVLKASGHVERFIDWMVKDVLTGECFRADHLIKNQAEALIQDKNTKPEVKDALEKVLQQLDDFSDAQMEEVIRKFDFKSPATKNELSAPLPFNLMFPTQIGPVSDHRAYLRPETAQGIFVNFKRLLEFNQVVLVRDKLSHLPPSPSSVGRNSSPIQGKLPFAAAQIGSAFRNEISPRQGLIRVREFTLAEIEHFVDPADKTHPKFKNVANVELNLFSACDQRDGKSPTRVRIGEAVAKGIVNSETLGYYMARTHLYLLSVGVDAQRLRFRQHLSNEMAHYAQDCWDAECHTSYGWIECVGHADRACYDLDQHSKATGEKLVAERLLDKARVASVVEAAPNKAVIGKRFKSEGQKIISHLEKMGEEQVLKLEEMLQQLSELDICVDGNTFKLEKGMVEIKRYEKAIHIEEIHPSVIEPSFGIGRIMYVVLEHSFRQREADEKRNFLDLPPSIAPIKCAVLPLSQDKRFDPILEAVREQLISHGMSQKTDTSGSSIGRRYARNDEIGIPFDITVDFDSLNEPWTVTLRHASSLQQVRLKVDQVGSTVSELVNGRCTWQDVAQKLPVFERNDQD